MKRRTKRAASRAMRQQGTKPKGKSRYARKADYLRRVKLFGFQVPEPKPWR